MKSKLSSTLNITISPSDFSVVKKCVFINPRGNHLMLQTNLNELIVVETESGIEVIDCISISIDPIGSELKIKYNEFAIRCQNIQ